MKLPLAVPLLVAAGLAPAWSAPAGGSAAIVLPDSAATLRLGAIREEARLQRKEESLADWATQTQGAESKVAGTYAGHEELFSRGTIDFVRSLADSASDPRTREALRFLEFHLEAQTIEMAAAPFDDRLEDAADAARVTVRGWDKPIAFNDLTRMMAVEADTARCRALASAQAEILAGTLNPIMARRQAVEDSLVRELGYKDYITFSAAFRNVELDSLVARSFAFIQATDRMYQTLLAEEAREWAGKAPTALRRTDLERMSRMAGLDDAFPDKLLLPAFDEFLKGLGLDRRTAGGTEIVIDGEARPAKSPRAACFPIEVPNDVRVNLKPVGGLSDFETLFHEGGHAVYSAWTTDPLWEFQQLGNAAVGEGIGELFAGVWGDPEWLARYASLGPHLSEAQTARIIRHRIFRTLFMIRRYAGARLLYETILHKGDPGLVNLYYLARPSDDLQEVYRTVFGFAYGFYLTKEEALRFRTDVDPFLYSADYARAFLLAGMLDEGLNNKFGAPWFVKPEAGEFLKTQIFAGGTRLQPTEAVHLLGYDRLSYTPLRRRLERLFQLSEEMLERERR